MGLVSTFLGILGFLVIGFPVGLIVGFYFFVYSEPKEVKDPIITPLDDLDSSAFLDLIPEIPNWVKCPDYERVDWLNKFMLDLWPYLDKAICNIIRSTAIPIFEDYIGKYQITDIEFENLSLGTLPPTFNGMKVYETNENQVVMEPAIKWAGNPNIVVAVKLMSVQIRFQLVDLQVFANPRIHLKPLVPVIPCFANAVVSLMEKPHVDFGLNVLGGDIMSIPGLYGLVQKTIKKQVASLYHWPQYLDIPILDTSTSAVKKPVGILHVNVVRAIKLLKMDVFGASDPYVKLSLTGEKIPAKKTSTKLKNLNPEWNEKFKLIVKDPETQALELHVYDWDKVGVDDRIGMQVVPLKQLIPHETKEFRLNLHKNTNMNDPHNKKPRGQLVVELTFDPLKLESESFKGSSFNKGSLRSFKGPKGELISSKQSSLGSALADDQPMGEAGVLVITVIGAEDIEGEHHTNPYVQILFRGEKKKTQVVRRKRDPRWNEVFEFMIEEPPLDDKLHIEVLSKSRALGLKRRESLGYVEIALADVVHNGRINEKYHLIDSKNGILQVEIEWRTT